MLSRSFGNTPPLLLRWTLWKLCNIEFSFPSVTKLFHSGRLLPRAFITRVWRAIIMRAVAASCPNLFDRHFYIHLGRSPNIESVVIITELGGFSVTIGLMMV
jgi:hypothetical protein